MKHTVTTYELVHLVQVEVTRWPRSRFKKIQLILGGEAKDITLDGLSQIFKRMEEMKRDLKF